MFNVAPNLYYFGIFTLSFPMRESRVVSSSSTLSPSLYNTVISEILSDTNAPGTSVFFIALVNGISHASNRT